MRLAYKPDFEEAARRWDAFWEREILDRPVLVIRAPKEGVEPAPHPGQLAGMEGGYRKTIEIFDAHLASLAFLAEAVPFARVGFGPDQFAAFLGAELKVSPDSEATSWAEPFVEDWDEAMPLRIEEDNPRWRGILEFARVAAEMSEGKFLVGHLDIHSNMDALAAIRGPQRLCLDMAEAPDAIDRAMRQARGLFAPVYDAVYEAGNMQRGTIGWIPAYCRGKYLSLQCDFICMISPEMGRRFVIPALEEEAAFLDHSIYHFDGPDALPHLDDICGIRDINAIQWVQGAGNGDHIDWLDLLKEIQSKGKGLEVRGTPDQVKALHRELDPRGVMYNVSGVKSEREGQDLIEWFMKNT